MPKGKSAKPYASKAQQRKLHALAGEGKISKAEVHRKDKATQRKKGGFQSLPARKGRKKS